jgi:F-type H+-transporting ATPase subunit delta
MLAQQVAKKYSAALFNIVKEQGLMDQAYGQFEEMDRLLLKEKSLIRFLVAPHIPDQHKVELVRHVFEGKIEPLFLEFMLVLVRKYRIGFLHDIIIEFRRLVAEAKGLVVAKIITAVPMTEPQRRALIERLAAKTGHTIELDEKVDKSILGGMIIIIGDQIIDGSVRHKLGLLRDELMKLKVA